MSYPEEYTDVYDSVAAWGTSPASTWTAPWVASDYFAPLYQKFWHAALESYMYDLSATALDPLLDDIKAFFANISSWTTDLWFSLAAGLVGIENFIEALWNTLAESISSLATAIKDEIMGISNFLGNIYTWISWSFLSELEGYAAALLSPLVNAWGSAVLTMASWFEAVRDAIAGLLSSSWDWVIELIAPLWTWLLVIKDAIWDALVEAADIVGAYISAKFSDLGITLAEWLGYIWEAIAAFLQEPIQWILDLFADTWAWLEAIKDSIWDSLTEAAALVGAYIGEHLGTLATNLGTLLKELIEWIWADIKATYGFVVDDIIPAIADATAGPLGWLKDQFVNIIGLGYDAMLNYARSFTPMTPEKSVDAAKIMFGSAVGFGALAHGMALAVEAIPNVKWMGTHYLSAFVAQMGSFGLIASATMGVIAALAIREPFSYYMKSLLRPTQPREMDLQIMAVKPDIDIETFRQGMQYQGYSDFWIDAFQRTMFHEPSYFEMSMLGEDQAATDEWLYTKARRAGYIEEDAVIFVASMIKKVTRDQRKEFYKQSFNAFKEGYMTAGEFDANLDALDFRPEGRDLAQRAADLAYQFDLNKDLVTMYKKAFQDDMITDEELRASLSALGITAERADTMVELEWIRKEPKILKAEWKEFEKEWRQIQSKYSQLYIQAFRKELITESVLAANLITLGIKERPADAIARYEAIKLVPKPKPVEVIIPVIPAPPVMPTYEV